MYSSIALQGVSSLPTFASLSICQTSFPGNSKHHRLFHLQQTKAQRPLQRYRGGWDILLDSHSYISEDAGLGEAPILLWTPAVSFRLELCGLSLGEKGLLRDQVVELPV